MIKREQLEMGVGEMKEFAPGTIAAILTFIKGKEGVTIAYGPDPRYVTLTWEK